MSLTQDEKNEIRRENPTYPRVSRTTDPMVVRIDKTSLLVNDTMFTAKLKCGLGYKGYLIYSSGLGTPIYEKAAKTTGEWQKSFSTVGNRPYNIAFDSENTSQLTNVLTAAAKEWLDDLEIAIADRENDNAIKKAIDRLCWQLHYDITESHTDFATVFKDNDFANVQIDRYPMETEYWDGITLTTAISDSAGVTYKKDYGTDKCTVTIKDKGYLKDFDDHLTTGTYETEVVSDKTVVTKGSLMTVFDEHLLGGMYSDSDSKGAIKTFDDHLMLGLYNDKKGAITLFDEHLLKNYYDDGNGAFKKFNDALNDSSSGSLIKIGTKLVPDGANYYSISECLRDKNEHSGNTYSIARSLREGTTQTSVSQATHDQTELEATRFTKIDNNIGDCNINSDPDAEPIYLPLSDRIGKTGDSIAGNLSVAERVGDTGSVSVADRIGNTGSVSIEERIGVFRVGGDSVRRSLYDALGGDGGYAYVGNNALSNAIGSVNSNSTSIETYTKSVSEVIGNRNNAHALSGNTICDIIYGVSGHHFGIIGGPTAGSNSSFYTRSATPTSGFTWND